MKKSILLLVVLLSATAANAQFYSTMSSGSGGNKIWFNFGGISTFGTPEALIGVGQMASYSPRIKPESVDFNIAPTAMMVVQVGRESDAGIAHGFGFTFQYSTYEWMANFTPQSLNVTNNYLYRVGKKNQALFIGMGYEFEYRPIDRLVLGIGAGIGAELQFARQHRAEAVHLVTGQVYPDNAVNEWHDIYDENDTEFGVDIDFSLYGRLSARYYLTQTVFAGAGMQFKQALATTGNPSDLTTYSGHPAGYNICILDGRFSRLSYFLTLGFDF